MTTPIDEVPVRADAPTQDALARLARTEDLRFSPDNRRLAIAGFARDLLAIVDVEVVATPEGPELAVHNVHELHAPGLDGPHGVDWLDDQRLLVANRHGSVQLLRVDRDETGALALEARPEGSGYEGLHDPGSIVVSGQVDGLMEVLICNNAGERVSRHLLDPHTGSVRASAALAGNRLQIPDGIASSPDSRWVAVSNHVHRVVMVYERTDGLTPSSDPCCVLRGAAYPHGLRFTADGQHLLVADAGSPHLLVYARPSGGWRGALFPEECARVKDDGLFQRGRHSEQEGGPKGIDIDRTGALVALTSEEQPLAVFRLTDVLGHRDAGRRASALLAYELGSIDVVLERSDRANEAIAVASAAAAQAERRAQQAEGAARAAAGELDLERARHDATTQRAASAEEHLTAIQATRLFRSTRRARELYGRLWRR